MLYFPSTGFLEELFRCSKIQSFHRNSGAPRDRQR